MEIVLNSVLTVSNSSDVMKVPIEKARMIDVNIESPSLK